jgi:hypothetical protein
MDNYIRSFSFHVPQILLNRTDTHIQYRTTPRVSRLHEKMRHTYDVYWTYSRIFTIGYGAGTMHRVFGAELVYLDVDDLW